MNFPDHAIYAAFNGRVFALDRRDGSILWRWETPKGNFVTLLPDGDQLLVCSDGYLWALRAEDGLCLWSQPFKGEGTGIPFLASPRSSSETQTTAAMAVLAAAAAEEERRRQSSTASSTASTS
jgi:outer membrane protein assembly factor BamB